MLKGMFSMNRGLLLVAFAPRYGKQKPKEKAARELSPSHCQPFWNHIQQAGQPDFAQVRAC